MSQTKVRKHMKSLSGLRNSLHHTSWFSQGTSTYITSAGRATQLDTSSQEDFWMVSKLIPSLR